MSVRTRSGGLLASVVLLATSAAAENFDFEVGVTYNRTQLDAEQTIATNGGSIFNSNDIDTDAWSLFGSWYFAGLSDDNGPRARAAFVDRASVLNVGYARTDVSASTSVVSTDPLIPSFESSFDSDGDAYTLDLRYVWGDSGWFANGGVASTDTTIGGLVGSSVDSTVWRVGAGKYLFDTTTLALDVSQADDDGGDATNIAVQFSHLGDIGENWQYAVDLGYARTDADFDLEFDTWSAALSLYPNRDFEFGVGIAETDADFAALDSTSYEGFASWFVTPSVVLAARYRIDDVGYLGNVVIPSAETSRDADQDSISFGITVRF